MEILNAGYAMRPEAIEAMYYLWKMTGDEKYYDRGKRMFEDIEKYCQVENGYVQLADIRNKELKWDELDSYFFSETMGYSYLFFVSEKEFSLKDWVFTTEAHPLKNTWTKKWHGDYKLNE